MKLKFVNKKLKPYQWFYIGFFALYAAMLYFFLYHVNGLQPFQLNIHFFSNFTGSFSKRLLSELSPYALIFFLLYHFVTRKWQRVLLIAVFEILALINIATVAFYFVVRSNFQFYILEGFSVRIFLSYITPLVAFFIIATLAFMVGMALMLYRLKTAKPLWPVKKYLFLALLFLLAIGSPYLRVDYTQHNSLIASDSLTKKTYRTFSLENSGLTLFLKEIRHHFYPKTPTLQEISAEEADSIQSLNLDEHKTQSFPNPPKKILLVVVESLNQKFLSHYNPPLNGLTPVLDELIDKYPHIDEFYPSGPYTLQGVSATLCGHTNGRQAQNNPAHDCAPKLMKEAGFKNEFIRGATRYYVGENLSFKKFGFDNIFAKEDFDEKYPEFKEERPDLYGTWGFSDEYVFNEGIERLKNSPPDEKLFLTLLTLDTHIPGGRCSYEKNEADLKDPLQYSVGCFDRVFGDFITKLRKENLLDKDTVVLLTADQLYPAYNSVQGANLDTSFILKPAKIPFLMITEADLPPLSPQGSQVDIAATLLDLANLDIPSYYMGKSLLSATDNTPMGQDRLDGYIIAGDRFQSLSLNPQPFQKKTGPQGYLIKASFSTQEEFDAIVRQKAEEVLQERAQEGALFKWYYNTFYNLSGE